ncbi:type II toxin-antitoxin system RelE/ParE family toxin [Rubripirellula reticaptiva]|uniref:Plasmid stabilization system protein n=1 Tax=Rubripirellula reticaptiva TaxID=2528013 RepID=A0A5C6F8J0_9BACT|nr:type II toxin-antitoxin system RelE/ParE family toxin [Rubripirellula reticaptiva]TWU56039.1 Plasmid stabilization system protein [Rubripirellula reticaptiva]
MAKKQSGVTQIHLTDRALRDIEGIRVYSVKEFVKRVATQCVASLEVALTHISENAELLHGETDFDAKFQFYSAGKHLLICDRQPNGIFVLTVLHGSMDVPTRFAELQPTLVAEVRPLHPKLM